MKRLLLTLSVLAAVMVTVSAVDPIPVNWEKIAAPLTEGDLQYTATGQSIFGDYNNDGILDYFVVAGQSDKTVGDLYRGNTNGTFTKVTTEITPLAKSSAVFFDFDNDGNLDLLECGSVDGTTSAAITELYHNTGAPSYNLVLVETAPFIGITCEGNDNNTRLIEVVDYNNDGWLDVFMTGNHGANWEVSGTSRIVALYKNNAGTFELVQKPVNGTENFICTNGSSIHCGDVNNDGYADMIVSGYLDDAVKDITNLYINNKNGTFMLWQDSRTTFTGQMQGETFFVDVNNDGWLDIAEIGRDVKSGWANFANLFINNKNLTFTKAASTGLVGGQAVVSTGDINNDGWMDIAISGWGPNMTFFYNKGDNTFLANPINPDNSRARSGCINLVDFTNDGNLDFNIFGYRDGGGNTPENPTWPHDMLRNTLAVGITSNAAPSAPLSPAVTEANGAMTISWGKPGDDKTPADALRYNVYLKRKSDNKIFTYFPADIATGKLKAAGVRPLITGASITFNGMRATDYEIGVQAIDGANLASAFSMVRTGLLQIKEQMKINFFVRDRKINVENKGIDNISYTIYSVTGKTVHSGICTAGSASVSPEIGKGVYVISVSDGRKEMADKVVIL